MCTYISMSAQLTGSAKGAAGWFDVSHVCVGYDHPFHAPLGHALMLDFLNPELGDGARVALEMNIASGKVLLAQLQTAIEAAERSGVAE
jgi:hypothetical protein